MKAPQQKNNNGRQVTITHAQEVRSSFQYQSASASYGVTLTCADDPAQIQATLRRAEKLVEQQLVKKVEQQRLSLTKLAEGAV